MNYQDTMCKYLSAKANVEKIKSKNLRKSGQTARANAASATEKLLRLQARKKEHKAEVSGCLRAPMPEDAPRTAAGSLLDRPVGPVAGA